MQYICASQAQSACCVFFLELLEELGMRKQGLFWVIGLALLVACGANSAATPMATPAATEPTVIDPAQTSAVTEVTGLTHDRFAVSPEVLAKFEAQ